MAPEAAEAYVFRGPVMKRLTAEQFLDGIRAVVDVWPAPDGKAFKAGGRGQGAQLSAVMAAHGLEEWDQRPIRSAFQVRDPLQAALGRPNREQVVTARPDMVTTLEAITLANGPHLAELLKAGAAKLAAEASLDGLVERLYLGALSRKPTTAERAVARSLVGSPPDAEGIEDLLWTVFMLPEYQFNQ